MRARPILFMARFNQKRALCTGGSGRLGTELKKLLPKALFPSSAVFNVTNHIQMEKYIRKNRPSTIIHSAAFISPPLIDKDPQKAIDINIIATAALAKLCWRYKTKLVYISTDYVFKGDKGNYKEDDPIFPVNKYAWSKLGGECAVNMLDDYLIIRTSFGEKVFPFQKAFVDHYTSRETVDVIAKKIVTVLKSGVRGTIHLGHARRSVYQYAKSLGGPTPIGKMSIDDVPFAVPKDTSLNTTKYRKYAKK